MGILWQLNHGRDCSDEGDRFEEKRNVQSVEVGESKEYSYSVSVL